jgi:NAD(P)-dependent dehydrogenase (short-subunit alcohol dehydrogenase family)
VTGGGTGIGLATAQAFARLGSDLVLAGRRADLLEQAASRLREQHGVRVECVPTNIREPAAVDALRDAAYAAFGRVDTLVNNAGGQFPVLPSQLSDNGWRSVVDLNLNGTWTMLNRFMGPMVEAGGGTIVTMVHTYVFDRGARFFVHSGAARAGVLSLTRTMASFLAPHGVTVNAIAPGLIDTSGMREHEGEAVAAIDLDALGQMGLKTTRRMGSTDEVAAGIVWLASPAARYVTGTVLVVDGGLLLDNWPDPWDRDAF